MSRVMVFLQRHNRPRRLSVRFLSKRSVRFLARSVFCFFCFCLIAVGATEGRDITPPLPAGGNVIPSADSTLSVRPEPATSEILIEVPAPQGESETGIAAWLEPSQASSTLHTIGLLSIISLAPAVALMTTSYVRVAVVLTLLRQGLGAQGLPSNQMISALALFISAVVMSPVWTQVYEDAVVPYSDPDSGMSLDTALEVGIQPVRQFMLRQIVGLGNVEDIWLFYRYLPEGTTAPESYDEVPLSAILPAFMLSELKTAFLIGFRIYLPFLILDVLVASVTVSMGMFMLPPAYVSLPFKLLLFVMVDGWHLLVEMLLKSFVP